MKPAAAATATQRLCNARAPALAVIRADGKEVVQGTAGQEAHLGLQVASRQRWGRARREGMTRQRVIGRLPYRSECQPA